MSLGWPLALIGLLALAIPLAIHLLQRGHHATVAIATAQFVPSEYRPQWRLRRLRERWLWLLRSLLLIAAVILVAEPFTTEQAATADGPAITLVSPAVDAATARGLVPGDADLRWLAPGFPSLDESAPDWRPRQLLGKVWHAEKMLPSNRPLRVIAPARSAELGSVRPRFARDIQWIDAADTLLAPKPAAELVIVHDRASDSAHLELLAQAWADAGLPVDVRRLTPQQVEPLTPNLIWLSATPWRDVLALDTPGTVVIDASQPPLPGRVVQRDARGHAVLVESVDAARRVRRFDYLMRADTPETNDPTFAVVLADAALPQLAQTPPALPVSPTLLQRGALDTSQALRAQRRPLDRTWVAIVLLLAALERAVAALPAGRAPA